MLRVVADASGFRRSGCVRGTAIVGRQGKDKELKDLRTLTNEANGGILFNLPSGVEIDGDINVLMMSIEPFDDCLVVRLMFMDPAQFQT